MDRCWTTAGGASTPANAQNAFAGDPGLCHTSMEAHGRNMEIRIGRRAVKGQQLRTMNPSWAKTEIQRLMAKC